MLNFILTGAVGLFANTCDAFPKNGIPTVKRKSDSYLSEELLFFKLFNGVIHKPIRIFIVAKHIA